MDILHLYADDRYYSLSEGRTNHSDMGLAMALSEPVGSPDLDTRSPEGVPVEDAASQEIATQISEIRDELAYLRQLLDTAGVEKFVEGWNQHLADCLVLARTAAQINERQAMVGRATVAIGRTLLELEEEQRVPRSDLRRLIERLETSLGATDQISQTLGDPAEL